MYPLVKQAEIRSRLSRNLNSLKIRQANLKASLATQLNPLRFALGKAKPDIVVTHCEINQQQGVGILLQRIFPDDRNILSIRSRNLYGGRQRFGCAQLYLNQQGQSREQLKVTIARLVRSGQPQHLLSVPYYPEDVLTSLALKDYFNIPLCTYLMDDQNISVHHIPDDDMQELLARSDLRLGISRELCRAYEAKYGHRFWFLPPVVSPDLVQTQPPPLQHQPDSPPTGILIGNIWSQQWLDRLRQITEKTGHSIHWYGQPNPDWLHFDTAELAHQGIQFKGYYPEHQLVQVLRQADYGLLLTGNSKDPEDRPELAQFSLPSRLPYLIAVANLPILVMGGTDTAAARFVVEFDLGLVCDYSPESFDHAVNALYRVEQQQHCRQQAANIAPTLAANNIDTWIWNSLKKGQPINLRFEQLGTTLDEASAVVTTYEVNQRHGTGPLVERLVEGTPQILSIYSCEMYGGEQTFGDLTLHLSHQGLTRQQALQQVRQRLGNSTVKQILCVPYRPDDLITALALADLYQAPLGAYIMDDQNICVQTISDALMDEFLSRCSLRFATHSDLRDAYRAKFGYDIYILPALVPGGLVVTEPALPSNPDPDRGILIGSIWSKQWLDLLCATVKQANLTIDWYGNTQYSWLVDDLSKIKQQGIRPWGLLPEKDLAERLTHYPFAIVPTGTLDYRDNQQELSRLSLPGRIIFILATSHTPIIVLGNPDTPAARFVNQFKVGVSCDYDGASLQDAIEYVTQPSIQNQLRHNAALLSRKFSSKSINSWLWQSIHQGTPLDLRFEELFSNSLETSIYAD
jgi:hypothetical protein